MDSINAGRLDDLQDQFNLPLPFRGVNLSFESPVSCKEKQSIFRSERFLLHSFFYSFGVIFNWYFLWSYEIQKYRELANEIRDFYFKNAPINNSTRNQYLLLLSDINFVYHSAKAAFIHGEKASGKSFLFQWVKFPPFLYAKSMSFF